MDDTGKETKKENKTIKKAIAKKSSAFVNQLQRSNSDVRDSRAQRIGKAVSNAQGKLIMDIEEKIMNRENELEAMMDLTADNQTTTMNVISPDFDAAAFVARINDLQGRIDIDKLKLKIAQDTNKKWFK